MDQIHVDNRLSEPKLLQNGVPQGSTISCTLFAIAINDIASNIEPLVTKCLCVDDLSIFVLGKTISEISNKLQMSIDIIQQNGSNVGYQFFEEKHNVYTSVA